MSSSPEAAQIEAMIAALERDARQAAAERAERDEQRAVEARAGRLGPDWQEVQRRIDRHETSVHDVFTGRDDTPAARRLVETSQRNLTELGQRVQQDDRLRAELADLDAETAQWESPEVVDGGVTPTGSGPGVPGVRSATDPTTGAAPVDIAAAQDPPADRHVGGTTATTRRDPDAAPGAALRDPVANRVDATGIEPARPGPEAEAAPNPADPADPTDPDAPEGSDGPTT